MASLAQIEKRVMRAIHKRQMFRGGDRIAVGVSGGKDSSLLLYILARLRHKFKTPFELEAFRVIDPESVCHRTGEGSIKPFQMWCESMNIRLNLLYPEKKDVNYAKALSPCFTCSRRRRETLFKEINTRGFQILALGHTAFDFAVTALMNIVYHGKLETMSPDISMFQNRIRIVRPLSVVSETEVLQVARKITGFTFERDCVSEIGQTRYRMELVVRSFLEINTAAVGNIIQAASQWNGMEN